MMGDIDKESHCFAPGHLLTQDIVWCDINTYIYILYIYIVTPQKVAKNTENLQIVIYHFQSITVPFFGSYGSTTIHQPFSNLTTEIPFWTVEDPILLLVQ
jgi:hypothetical protein